MDPEPSAAAKIPQVGEGKRGEAGYFGYLLRQAANAQRRRMDRALAAVGLTHPQFLVMTMIRAYPGCSNADIARLAMLTPQTVHAIISTLSLKGLAARRPDLAHGRILNIELTDTGAALLEEGRSRALAVESDLQQMLSTGQARAVRRWLVGVARDAPLTAPGSPRSGAAARSPAAPRAAVRRRAGSTAAARRVR
ncbi:MAG: MarR family winged helix-turn-helix transcriptional regulator [Steroidobacteraceae bacterium]